LYRKNSLLSVDAENRAVRGVIRGLEFVTLYNILPDRETNKLRVRGCNNLEVKVIDNQLEKALRTLKRKLVMSGVFKDIKKQRYYVKPSVKKKLKQKEALKKRLKSARAIDK
jgi:small subunit ribosomal protein S21